MYYPDPVALYYMTARAFLHSAPGLGKVGDLIATDIEGRRPIERPLATALAACTMLTFKPESPVVPDAVRNLLRTQRKDGSWSRYAFYRGPDEFWGSEELTTALCTEALARYLELRRAL